MNNEDYCSYELSKALKDAGFDEPCDKWMASKSFSYYDEDECCDHNAVIRKGWLISQKQKEKYDQEALPYLSLWHAQKWLREKKGIDVLVYNCACGYLWELSKSDVQNRGTILMAFDDNGEDKDSGCWLTYEAALSAGISAALDLLAGKEGEG